MIFQYQLYIAIISIYKFFRSWFIILSDKIKELRLKSGLSQAEVARRLQVTRSSVNAWEMGLNVPTTQYIVELSKLFNVSSDYILGIENNMTLDVSFLNAEELNIIYNLINYFQNKKSNQ